MKNNETVEIIKENCPIEDVVSQYTRLTGSKPQLKGMCPLHKDNKPSFFVNTSRGVFYCHGCHKGGDVITFVQEAERVDFKEAVMFLSDKYGLDINGFNAETPLRKQYLHNLQKYAVSNLWSDEGDEALHYLRSRALDEDHVELHGIGFLPDTIQTRMLLRSQYADELGLRRLIGRITFPFYSGAGSIIGYGGRGLTDNVTPKYTNTTNNARFQKSKCLFGFNAAKKQDIDLVVVAEGYLDVLAINEAGILSAVATCGTALTEEHAKKISNRWNEVVLCMDSDPAGISAVMRSIPLLYKHGLKVYVAELEPGQDPASTPRRDLLIAIQESRPGYEVVIDNVSTNPFEAANQLRPILMSLPIEGRYSLYERVGAKLGLPQSLFTAPSTGMPPAVDVLQPAPNPNMDYLLMFIIHNSDEIDAVAFLSPSDISDTWYKWAYEKLYDGVPVGRLIELSRDNPVFASMLSRLANTRPPEDFARIATQAACVIAAQSIANQIYQAINQEPADFELIKRLQQRRMRLMSMA